MSEQKHDDNARVLPTVDYEPLVHARAQEISKRNAKEDDYPEREASRLMGHIDSQWEKFEAWQALGEHYANTLENPNTPVDVHNAIAEELVELANQADLSIDSAEVVRLLYPLLRDRAAHRQGRE